MTESNKKEDPCPGLEIDEYQRISGEIHKLVEFQDRIQKRYSNVEDYLLAAFSIIIFILTAPKPTSSDFFDISFLNNFGTIEALIFAFAPNLLTFSFRLIFGVSPFTMLRSRFGIFEKRLSKDIDELRKRRREFNVLYSNGISSEESYYASLSESSRKLSSGLYNRAGAFLLFGGAVAIGGLIYFSYEFTPTLDKLIVDKDSPLKPLPFMLSKFGALIFLELLAFFLLRQYKFTMDEFRYYQGVQRLREENLFYIKLLREEISKRDLVELLREGEAYDRIKNTDSSLIIESKKLHNDELELLNKVVDKIKLAK